MKYRMALFSCFVLLCVYIQPVNVACTEPKQPWRCAANGGVNVLYCYLQCNGVRINYDDLVKESRSGGDTSNTALSVAQLATKKGLSLRPVSLTMDELEACSLPVIVHMDGVTPEAGAFLLILQTTDKKIVYFNGPSATIHSITRENFRRIWSGIALMPAASRRKEILFCAIGLTAGLALSLGYHLLRQKWSLRAPNL